MSEPADVPPQDAVPPREEGAGPDTGETWDEVKADYQVEPDGRPVPNSMAPSEFDPVGDDEGESQGGSEGEQ